MLSTQRVNLPLERPFAFIRSGSAGRILDGLYARILADAGVQQLYMEAGQERLLIKSDLKARITSKGRVRIRRFYWSLQMISAEEGDEFRARTLNLTPDQPPHWLDFPEDPSLPSLPDLMNHQLKRRVLQYVPLRRVTLLHSDANGACYVLKLKRPGRGLEAASRLVKVNNAFSALSEDLEIPSYMGFCAVRDTYRQSYCPGQSLSHVLNATPSLALISRIGSALATFHHQDASKLPERRFQQLVELKQQLAWLCAVWPDAADRISRCYTWLSAVAAPEPVVGLCHGDLSTDQFILDRDRWYLVDLDLAHRGDTNRDVAQMLTRLYVATHDSELSPPDIQNTLLAGYKTAKQPGISDHALRWFGCCAELEQLAISFRKDSGDRQSRLTDLLRAETHVRDGSR